MLLFTRIFLDYWHLQMGPIGCPETSAMNYHYSLRNDTEEHSSQLINGASLKSHTEKKFICSVAVCTLSDQILEIQKLESELKVFNFNHEGSYTGWSESLCASDSVYSNNLHTFDNLKMAIAEYTRNVGSAILNTAFENTVRRVNKCLETVRWHFEHYL